MSAAEREFIPLGIAVLTISDTRTEDTDKSGRLLVERLSDGGPQRAADAPSFRIVGQKVEAGERTDFFSFDDHCAVAPNRRDQRFFLL